MSVSPNAATINISLAYIDSIAYQDEEMLLIMTCCLPESVTRLSKKIRVSNRFEDDFLFEKIRKIVIFKIFNLK